MDIKGGGFLTQADVTITQQSMIIVMKIKRNILWKGWCSPDPGYYTKL